LGQPYPYHGARGKIPGKITGRSLLRGGLPRRLSERFAAKAQNAAIPVREGKSIGNIWLLYFFTGLSKKKTLNALVEAELAAAKDFKADLIVTERDPDAYLAAYIANLPIVTTYALSPRRASRANSGSAMSNS
jgi:hypothetical protein